MDEGEDVEAQEKGKQLKRKHCCCCDRRREEEDEEQAGSHLVVDREKNFFSDVVRINAPSLPTNTTHVPWNQMKKKILTPRSIIILCFSFFFFSGMQGKEGAENKISVRGCM
jgi:hypothetical protein